MVIFVTFGIYCTCLPQHPGEWGRCMCVCVCMCVFWLLQGQFSCWSQVLWMLENVPPENGSCGDVNLVGSCGVDK